MEAREVSLRRALQLAAAHESHGMQKGVQSEETLRALLTIKDDKIGALERCVRELETQLRRYAHLFNVELERFVKNLETKILIRQKNNVAKNGSKFDKFHIFFDLFQYRNLSKKISNVSIFDFLFAKLLF